MTRRGAVWAAWLLAGFLAGASAAAAEPPASALVVELEERARRVEAYCGLAAKAWPVFPGLAREVLGRALEEARRLQEPRVGQALRRLRSRAAAAGGERDAALAERLAGLAGASWRFRLVAQGALGLDGELASQALELGLAAARARPPGPARDGELARLAVVAARRDAPRARRLLAGLADPLARSRGWRELARLTRSEDDILAAAAAAEASPPAAGGLALARAAGLAWSWRPGLGRELFARAHALAGQADDARRGAWAQGMVAARLAEQDPAAGRELAGRVPEAGGARYAALQRAAAGLLASRPGLGRRAWREALAASQGLAGARSRHRAWAQLAECMAPVDAELARKAAERIPSSAGRLRAAARAAMVLAAGARGLPEAWKRARDLADRAIRLRTLARLAVRWADQDPARGRRELVHILPAALESGVALPRRALVLAWQGLQPSRAVELVQKVEGPRRRVGHLLVLAEVLRQRQVEPASRWCLYLALDTIKKMGGQEMLDKVGLLGDMGREWSLVDPEAARRFFALGAETAAEPG